VKAPVVKVDPALGSVVGAEAAGIAAFAALPTYRFGWWPATVITVVALVTLLVTVHRRNVATWVIARARWMRARRYTTAVGAAVDISHGGEVYGVRTAGNEAVTVVEVDGRAYSPTFLRGSTVSRTDNVLPLGVLTALMEQPGGLLLEIDIVCTGHRVRPGSGYPQLYSTLLADRGAAGQRTTYLIVRLDIRESTRGLVYRRSIGSAAAAATERIINALQQHDIRAAALGAEQHDAVLDELSVGLAHPPPRPLVVDDDIDETLGRGADRGGQLVGVGGPRRSVAVAAVEATARQRVHPKAEVGWHTVNANPGYVTSYYFSPEDITADSFNQMWSLRSDHIVHSTMLRKRPGGPVTISALVRTTDPRRPEQLPTLFLNPLPGDQYAAALRAAPTTAPQLNLPARVLDPVGELQIPIGSTGILVGAALRDDTTGSPEIQRDDLVMWALNDPQRPTRIVMDASDFYVRQLLIRAAAAGERIAIYSYNPRRWYSVSQPNIAVVESGHPAEFVPTIIVNDWPHSAPAAGPGLSSTVITLSHSTSDTAPPDIRFEQISQSSVKITTATRSLDVAMVVFRQEQTWTG
jgi:type VII secretion protein EccE